MELELYGDYVVLSDVCDEGDPIVQEAVSVIKERVTLAIQEAGLSALEWDTTVEVRKVEQYSDEVWEEAEKAEDMLDFIQRQTPIGYKDCTFVAVTCKAG